MIKGNHLVVSLRSSHAYYLVDPKFCLSRFGKLNIPLPFSKALDRTLRGYAAPGDW